MTREEAEFVVRYLAQCFDKFQKARAGYRQGKRLRKGEDIELIAEDYALWSQGEDVLRRNYKPSYYKRVVQMMRVIDQILEGKR